MSIIGDAIALLRLWLDRRRSDLELRVSNTGGGSRVTFTANVSNVGTAPAMDCVLTASIEDRIVFESPPFNLAAGQLDHPVSFGIERPRYATLVPELYDAFTLYGRTLVVEVRSGKRRARADVEEERCDPDTDADRYAAQQAAWAQAPPFD